MKNRGIQQEIPRMEHPRPQLERESWETLNGLWEFDFDFSQSGIDENGMTFLILMKFWSHSARKADCRGLPILILSRQHGIGALFLFLRIR